MRLMKDKNSSFLKWYTVAMTNRNIFGLFAVLAVAVLLSGCISEDPFVKSLPSKDVELSRYLGTWYEIARIPNWFEKDLVGVTATYTLKPDGEIEVRNEGRIKTLDGEKKTAIGRAWVPDPDQPGRLKVSFFWLVSADYIVVELDKDYQYALVGSGRDYLWILSRTPQMDEAAYQGFLDKATSLGYDISRIEKVKQSK